MDKKPMLLVNEDLSEGVYADSGTPAMTETSYQLKMYNSWPGGKSYKIAITNNSAKTVDSVTVTLKVNGTVTGISSWNVSVTLSGSTAKVTFNNYGNKLEPYKTYGELDMQVSGTGEFSLE